MYGGKNRLSGIILTALLVAVGCQKESDVVNIGAPEAVFDGESAVAKQITQVVLHDGSYDNFLDHASCVSIKLPFTVKVENKYVILNTEADVKDLKMRIDERDKVRLKFPVTLITADYTETGVDNTKALQEFVAQCPDDTDNECVDFQFPLTVYTYNVNNQVKDTKSIADDRSFFFLIKDLHKDELAAIRYPINILPGSATPLSVANNSELEDRIGSFSNTCDEDDVEEGSMEDFEEILTDKKWEITYFFDNIDRTSDYDKYEFDFKSNHTVEAHYKSTHIDGVWDVDDNELGLLFWGNFFSRLDHHWVITTYDESKIRLENDDSILIFEVK